MFFPNVQKSSTNWNISYSNTFIKCVQLKCGRDFQYLIGMEDLLKCGRKEEDGNFPNLKISSTNWNVEDIFISENISETCAT